MPRSFRKTGLDREKKLGLFRSISPNLSKIITKYFIGMGMMPVMPQD